jgi:5,10-methylenetetrahydromethanopterin reductase
MGSVLAKDILDRARRIEADGWDGMEISDTQCLFGDTAVMMTAAALATGRLKFTIGTSNPATRHPSIAASMVASLAAIAGDRISFGVGRGDSSLAYIGGAPASLRIFERYVVAVRRYLHGEPVAMESISEWRLTEDVSTIPLGHAVEESRLTWLDPNDPPPAIDVYATGPRSLGVAGRAADRVCISVGADLARLEWAIETARAARAEVGLDPATLRIAAVVNASVDDDLDRARRRVAGRVATSARFAVMNGSVVGPVTEAQRQVYEAISRSYDMNRHTGHRPQIGSLTDDFVDSFGIVGTAKSCSARMLELRELGVDSLMVGMPSAREIGDSESQENYLRLVNEVLPAVRTAL